MTTPPSDIDRAEKALRCVQRFQRTASNDMLSDPDGGWIIHEETLPVVRDLLAQLDTQQTLVERLTQERDELKAELHAVDAVLARRPAIATEPTRASAVEKACFVAGQQSDRANRLEAELTALHAAQQAVEGRPWQDMATAPKDGTWLWMFDQRKGRLSAFKWDEAKGMWFAGDRMVARR